MLKSSSCRHHVVVVTLALTFRCLALDVAVYPDKLWVKPGEPVKLLISVDRPEANVACRVLTDLDTVAAEFTGKPDADGKLSFTFIPNSEWGYDAVVTVTAGGETATASEVFACAISPFKVAVDYSVPEVYGQDVLADGSPAPEGPVQNPHLRKRIDQQVARFRHQYLTVGELMGPAFCSFSSIVPPTPNYFKGHHYNYSVNAVRELIGALRANGIASLIYVNSSLSGLAGTEFARQHPEFLAYSADGTPYGGGLDLSTVAAQKDYVANYPESLKRVQADPEYRKRLTGPYPGFINALQDFRNVRLAEIGAEKIIEGQKYFGYDGVRYDGEYCVPSIGDPLAPSRDYRNWEGVPQTTGMAAERLTTRNLTVAFDKMRKHDPDLLIGMNNADFRSDQRGDTILTSEAVVPRSPGCMILDEVVKGALSPSAPDHLWPNFIRNMSAQADRVRQVDNYLFGGWGGGPGQKTVDTKQVKAVAWACGLRWICGGYSKEQWFADIKRDYNRFALRYSQFILDNRLQRLSPEDAEQAVTVTASRPVLWQHFVQRLSTEDGQWLVLHLVNEPLEKGLTPEAQPPPAAENTVLALSPAETVKSAWFISPDGGNRKLDVQSLSLPPLMNWGMVVIEQ